MKPHILTSAILLLFGSALAIPAAAQGPKRVLYIEAQHSENVAYVANVGTWTRAPSSLEFLDRRYATELVVGNRKFLTDYIFQISGVTTIAQPSIRGLEEAANLTLGAPSLIAPPSKGGVTALTARNTSDIFGQLLDETQADKPLVALEAEYQETTRQGNQIRINLEGLDSQYKLVAGTGPVNCDVIGGAPNFAGVLDCLSSRLAQAGSGPWAMEPFTNENEFRVINVQAKYLLDSVMTLQSVISQANLPIITAAFDADLTQFEKNVDIFQANVRATDNALALYRAIRNDPARRDWRRDSLKLYFKNLLKATATDQTPVVDEAELNRLVEAYLKFLTQGGGFQIVEASVARLRSLLPGYGSGITRQTFQSFRLRLSSLEFNIQTTLPAKIAAVNAAQSQLVERINYIYDHSAVSDPLVKQIDLSNYPGNLVVYYTVQRVENFKRYAVVTPVVAGGPSAAAQAAGTPLPPATSAATSSATTPPTTAPQTTPSTTPAPNAIIVAQGSFQVHQFDQATVVAGFVFSTLRNNSFSSQQKENPDGTTSNIAILSSSQRGQPHVLLGIDYYLKAKDTFPGIHHNPADCFGILGGASLNSLNNYFLGLACEPRIGFTFGVGAHFGTETALQAPFQVNGVIPSSTVPTFERRTTGLFFMAGFDLQIFRKIFGKVTGVGTSATAAGK